MPTSLKSGDVVPPGEYTSAEHVERKLCTYSPRQISAPLGKTTLPRCRCGGELYWQAAPGGHTA